MSGIIGKTSILILMCLFIAYCESSDCRNDVNCASCNPYVVGTLCNYCKQGYHRAEYSDNTCYKDTCFPGSSIVTTPTGNVAMETLHIGDSVLTEIGNNQLGFTKVVSFAQREPGKEGQYLSITAVNQAGYTHTVKLTATHNIYVKTKMADEHDDYIPRVAADVFIGDMLKIQTDNGIALNEATVTYIALHKEMGAYSPLTETGTMLVDGTLVSCYASFNDYLAHLTLAPIRWFPWLFADEEKPLEGQLPYVEALKYIARNYVAPFISLK